jgi:hypothetical protein
MAACGTPELVGFRCSVQGECLAGYRCRQGICVRVSAEVCDGEDNNGNGLVDEDLYRAQVRSMQPPWWTGQGNTIPTPFLVAWSRPAYLAAWNEGGLVRFALLDAQGQSFGPAQTAALGGNLAVSAAPGGFAILYSDASAPRLSLKVVRLDPAGRASAPETLSSDGLAPSRLALAWDRDAPVAAVLHDNHGGCSPSISCDPRGAFLVRPAEPSQRLSRESAYVTDVAVAAAEAAVAVAWTECAPLPGGRPSTQTGRLGGIECVPEAARAQIRLFGEATEASCTLAGAKAVSLAWVGGDLVAAWHDVTDVERPRLMATRFSSLGDSRGADLVISEEAEALSELSAVSGPAEAAVVWNSLFGVDPRYQYYLARVDPLRGRVGAEIPLDVEANSEPVSLAFTGEGYSAWLGNATLKWADVRCSNEPLTTDGGGDAPDAGGVADGGAVPDAGLSPTGPACASESADGGNPIQGQVVWHGGIPAPGLSVVAGACLARTDQEGRFRAGDVVIPYDLTVFLPTVDWTSAYSYLEVRSTAPIVQLPVVDGPIRTTYFAGSFPGDAGPPFGELHVVGAALAYSSGALHFSSPFQVPILWRGPNPLVTQAIFLERTLSGEVAGAQHFPWVTVEDSDLVDLGALDPPRVSVREVPLVLPPDAGVGEVRTLLTIGEAQLTLAYGSPLVLRAAVLPEPAPGIVHGQVSLAIGESLALVSTGAIRAETTELRIEVPEPLIVSSPADGGFAGPLPVLGSNEVSGASYYLAVLQQSSADASPRTIAQYVLYGRGLVPGGPAIFRITANLGGPGFDAILSGARAWGPGRDLGPGQTMWFSSPASFVP